MLQTRGFLVLLTVAAHAAVSTASKPNIMFILAGTVHRVMCTTQHHALVSEHITWACTDLRLCYRIFL